MFFRLYALYLRYAACHADRLAGFSMRRHRGKRLGHVERIWRTDGMTRIVGWTSAPRLRISWTGGDVHVVPEVQ